MAFDNLTPDFANFSAPGVRTPYGVLTLPPATRVAAIVRSGLDTSGDDESTRALLVPTLAAGLNHLRSGRGDTVIVAPGHAENVVDATMLANLPAGCRILGVGAGGSMPVFRWTAAGGQWALSVNDCIIAGLRLRLEGFNGVTKAIAITGSDNLITGCDIECSSGASNLATIGIECGAGSTRAQIVGNRFRGVAAGVCTDIVKIASAVDLVRVTDNEMFAAATSATGLIHATAAATNMLIARNLIRNITASSLAGIGVDNVAATGIICDNYIDTLSTGAQASGTNGIFLGAGALIRAFQNFSANDPKTSGMLLPTVDT